MVIPSAWILPVQAKNLLGEQGRETKRGFVEEDHLGAGHQPAGNGAHLLFAAGERAGHLFSPFTKPRKKRENPFQRLFAVRFCLGRQRTQFQILDHRHFREELPSLGHMGDSTIDDAIGRHMVDALVFEPDGAARGVDDAGYGSHDRAFSGPVGTHQDDELFVLHLEGHVPEDLNISVTGVDMFHPEHGFYSLPRYASMTDGLFATSAGVP